ncbi:O-acyltransferase like protein-like [Portunus trituberculatus]|uniref:O-acyltransferase like protein-like n=1 Tax=Portunus trituberculatus TaxID=210409 RepID=UPI001E1CC80A|nr:O-acyltransferase like protein-like [Portunus trituberculatus]
MLLLQIIIIMIIIMMMIMILYYPQFFENIMAQTILNGFPSMDTLFFLSGFLLSYNVLKQTKRTKSFNFSFLYKFDIATVMHFFVSGPWSYIWNMYWQPMCAKNWWKDVTFINNFNGGSCLGQTWYIAADMQMYLVAPLVILPIYYYSAVGQYVTVLEQGLTPAPDGCIHHHPCHHLCQRPSSNPIISLLGVSTPVQTLNDIYFDLVYYPSWTRASPWLVGIWVGYIFFRQGNIKYKMSALVVTLGWTLAAITGLLVVFGIYSYNHFISPSPHEVMSHLTYGGLHRLAWGAVLGWVVFACHNGYGGVVNGFLSHPVWQPVSRLTYATYLVAFLMQYLLFYNSRDVYYFTHINTIFSTVGAVVIAIGAAVLLSLMAESPIVGLEKLLLRPIPTNGVSNPVFMTENSITAEKSLEASETVTSL